MTFEDIKFLSSRKSHIFRRKNRRLHIINNVNVLTSYLHYEEIKVSETLLRYPPTSIHPEKVETKKKM